MMMVLVFREPMKEELSSLAFSVKIIFSSLPYVLNQMGNFV